GRPVRVQWMRQDELRWDPKGPAQLLELKGAVDATGTILAWETHAWHPSGPQWTRAFLAEEAAGLASPGEPRPGVPVVQNADPPYATANLRVVAHPVADTPIRLSNLRSPSKIAHVSAVESFTDELAAAAGIDPLAFRRHGLTAPRAIAVLDRAAQMIGWQPRPPTSAGARRFSAAFQPNGSSAAPLIIGRGIAY